MVNLLHNLSNKYHEQTLIDKQYQHEKEMADNQRKHEQEMTRTKYYETQVLINKFFADNHDERRHQQEINKRPN